MSKFSRKLKRSKVLEKRKESKKTIKETIQNLNSIPEQCTFCKKDFNLAKDADSWMVNYSTGTDLPVQLSCPSCYKELKC